MFKPSTGGVTPDVTAAVLRGVRVRITRQVVIFSDGVAEITLPDPHEDSVHTHIRYERLNDRAVDLFFTEFLWEKSDDATALLASLKDVEEEEDSDE